jgi:hypothetical protein
MVSWGPPLLPIFPDIWGWPKFYDFVFYFDIDSKASSANIDFYRILIQFAGEQSIRPSGAYIWDKNGPLINIKIGKIEHAYNGELLNPGEIALSNKKVIYILKFDRLPSNVEEILLDFGTVCVDGKYLRLPPIKYRKISKYRYVPLHFGLQ